MQLVAVLLASLRSQPLLDFWQGMVVQWSLGARQNHNFDKNVEFCLGWVGAVFPAPAYLFPLLIIHPFLPFFTLYKCEYLETGKL